MKRIYPEAPRVALGAVILKGAEVLLVKRGSDPGRGLWTLPGGLMELGEGLQEGVRREVMEECGVHVQVGDLIEVVERVIRDGEGRVEYHYVILDFLAYWVEGDPVPSTDVVEARWVSMGDLAGYDLSPQAMAVILKALAMSGVSGDAVIPVAVPVRPTACG